MSVLYAIAGVGSVLAILYTISQFFWQLITMIVVSIIIYVAIKYNKRIIEFVKSTRKPE